MFRLNKWILFINIIFFSFIFNVNAIVNPTEEFYVNDYANILSNETEQYIIEKSKILNNTDGTQIVVVTVNNLEGLSIEDYSLRLARNFGIGDSKNKGLLLLLSLEEREFRVEVGYGLEGILNDSKTGRFQDQYIIPYLKNDNFDEGLKNGYNAFFAEIVKQNNLILNYNEPINKGENILKITCFLGLIMGIITGIIKRINKRNNNKNYSKIIIAVYIFVWFLIFLFTDIFRALLVINLIFFVIGFILAAFATRYSSKTNFSEDSDNDGISFTSGHSHGGGGSFGGGGSSRRF